MELLAISSYLDAFMDHYHEAEYFISTKKETIKETNFDILRRASMLLCWLLLAMAVIFWLFFDGYSLRPVQLVPPVLLFAFYKLTEKYRQKLTGTFETVRLLAAAFYLSVALIVAIYDLRMHPHTAAVFLPMVFFALAALYVDNVFVVLTMQVLVVAEYAVAAIAVGRRWSLIVQDMTIFLAAVIVAMFCYWVILGIYTEDSREERSLKEESAVDLLTGLLNKMSFEREAKRYLRSSRNDEYGALLIIDFDNFKSINDEHGHLVGDTILKKFGDILTKNFRESDIIGRVGGDEFMVLMTGDVPDGIIAKKCSDIQHELYISKVGDAGGFSCSIGVAVNHAGFDFKSIYRLADDALYEAKARGKAQYIQWFSQEIKKPDKTIVYIATPDKQLRSRIKKVLGDGYLFMESEKASKALNEISLYQQYLESVFFDYNMPDMSESVLRKYMNSRPVFSQIPVHDVAKEL
ncbi:MAG: GGDEF domain-containing protein [Lachnospiraceae bacterium]|nr:GGDEF domain-containing protein [Lachnospiraceae bacterium]